MKKQSIPYKIIMLITMIAATMIWNYTNARQIVMNYMPGKYMIYLEDSANGYKPMAGDNSLKLNNINMHAMRDFLLRYKEVNDTKWYKAEGGFVARFTIGLVETSVTYRTNGEWLYTISSYDENSMPEAVRAVVKSTYYGYNIVTIKEVQVPRKDNTIYLVYIQDATTIKELRIYEGEMEILHDYIRG